MKYRIRKILVPVDLSETSLNALNTAAALAVRHNAAVSILHVADPLLAMSERPATDFTIQDNTENVLNALAASITHTSDREVDLIQERGCVVETIIAAALREASDIIVMGSYGTSGYRKGFIGSATYGTMKHASCPVLALPSNKKFPDFKKAVFPIRPVSGALQRCDVVASLLADEGSMEVLGLAYRKMEKTTSILERIVDEVRDVFGSRNVSINTSWGHGLSIADEVMACTQQLAPDLIVTTPVLDVADKTGFIGPHAQKILNCSISPVLNIKGMHVQARTERAVS